jgi:hypothetical protein
MLSGETDCLNHVFDRCRIHHDRRLDAVDTAVCRNQSGSDLIRKDLAGYFFLKRLNHEKYPIKKYTVKTQQAQRRINWQYALRSLRLLRCILFPICQELTIDIQKNNFAALSVGNGRKGLFPPCCLAK